MSCTFSKLQLLRYLKFKYMRKKIPFLSVFIVVNFFVRCASCEFCDDFRCVATWECIPLMPNSMKWYVITLEVFQFILLSFRFGVIIIIVLLCKVISCKVLFLFLPFYRLEQWINYIFWKIVAVTMVFLHSMNEF